MLFCAVMCFGEDFLVKIPFLPFLFLVVIAIVIVIVIIIIIIITSTTFDVFLFIDAASKVDVLVMFLSPAVPYNSLLEIS